MQSDAGKEDGAAEGTDDSATPQEQMVTSSQAQHEQRTSNYCYAQILFLEFCNELLKSTSSHTPCVCDEKVSTPWCPYSIITAY